MIYGAYLEPAFHAGKRKPGEHGTGFGRYRNPFQKAVSAAEVLVTRYGMNASFAPLAEPPGVGPPATT
jgi:hypothetical protein